MGLLRKLWSVLTSRWLWSLIGLGLLGLIVWYLSPFVTVAGAEPFAAPAVRVAIIAGLVLLWLLWLILAQRRAIRANRLFVTELAAPEVKPHDPSAEGVAAVGARFQAILDELKRRRLGGKRLLRDMPWYVIIGPPAGGKTTALRQSGLDFPFDLSDDVHGVGGTRNCDWFFTEEAVLIDTAGRYTLQESHPEVDAAEWLGFLDLLRRHRGRRALNGVLVAIPVEVLAEGDAQVRMHGREIRKRLAEVYERLEMRLPVYLLVTKADLLKGFEPSFADLGTSDREQVWGATFSPGETADAGAVGRELADLVRQLETRVGPRMAMEDELATRAEVFRFPAQVASLEAPLRLLVETAFGESRYEESAWLRGFYLTSATQEGTPIDRLAGALASSFGLPVAPVRGGGRVAPRSFFLRRLLADVIFPEAGLATLDPRAEARRTWLWRGGAVAAAAVLVLGALGLTVSYLANRGALAAQLAEFDRLRPVLAPIANQPAPVEPSDLDQALTAATAVDNARVDPPGVFARAVGPSAAPAIAAAGETAYAAALRNILEPRMVAFLEATMWRRIRDADFQLGALKTYRMMTGGLPIDADAVADWWTTELPRVAEPFPNEEAKAQQLAAIARMPQSAPLVAADPALVRQALDSVCSISLARRAYALLLAEAAASAPPDWVPLKYAGPNGAAVFTRHSDKTLRVGVPGLFTYDGYHAAILPRLQEVAERAKTDRDIFAGCPESEDASVGTLSQDMLKLYGDDFIAQWDALLNDLTLAPLKDLATADANLKDLASGDSALRRLLTAVVAETDLARPAAPEAAAAPDPGVLSKYLGKFAKAAKLSTTAAARLAAPDEGPPPDTSGQAVADHFRPLKSAIAEVDGAPPALDAVAAALGALSQQIQEVATAPNQDQAIKDKGGLGQLTATVTNQAFGLPPPVDEWLRGITGDITSITREAVVSQLNAVWAADVRDWCRTVAARYPLDPTSRVDSRPDDFARVFGPGQLIDSFIDKQLAPFIDMSVRPWRWNADLGLDDKALASLDQARRIRDALFPGQGAGPLMSFTLEGRQTSQNAAQVSLNLDGQSLVYTNGVPKAQGMTWPGKDGSGVITLAFLPADGGQEALTTETGPWAWLRLLGENQLQPTENRDIFTLRLSTQGYSADFQLVATSVANPFDLRMFSGFSCPERF